MSISKTGLQWFLGLTIFWVGALAHARIQVEDDAGNTVSLARPAQRIVSLAPHVTELLFAAGAGDRIVGTVEFSDYPEAAKRIPRVGNNRILDIERIVAAKPDLLVVWFHGNAERQLDKLRQLGIPLFHSEPRRLDEVASSLDRLGRLAGTERQAATAKAELRKRLDGLRERYEQRRPVKLFYQVWDRPLMTLNGKHLIGEVIRVCGGVNPFADLPQTAPTVSLESVLAANPEAIITGSSKGEADAWLASWRRYPGLAAVQRGNLFTVDADLINRHGPRIVDGAEQLCRSLDQARRRR